MPSVGASRLQKDGDELVNSCCRTTQLLDVFLELSFFGI